MTTKKTTKSKKPTTTARISALEAEVRELRNVLATHRHGSKGDAGVPTDVNKSYVDNRVTDAIVSAHSYTDVKIEDAQQTNPWIAAILVGGFVLLLALGINLPFVS